MIITLLWSLESRAHAEGSFLAFWTLLGPGTFWVGEPSNIGVWRSCGPTIKEQEISVHYSIQTTFKDLFYHLLAREADKGGLHSQWIFFACFFWVKNNDYCLIYLLYLLLGPRGLVRGFSGKYSNCTNNLIEVDSCGTGIEGHWHTVQNHLRAGKQQLPWSPLIPVCCVCFQRAIATDLLLRGRKTNAGTGYAPRFKCGRCALCGGGSVQRGFFLSLHGALYDSVKLR